MTLSIRSTLPVGAPPAAFTLDPIAAVLRPLLGAGITLLAGHAFGQTVQAGGNLTEITVTGSAPVAGGLQPPHAGGQMARGGSLGLLGNADAMDVPFSTLNYTSELLEDQQARTLADVVVNDASVRVLNGAGGFGEDLQIRGYSVPSGDIGLNGLYGLTSTSRVPAEIIERVEVLKGPGTLVNGIAPNGSVGGSVNIQTKRAGDVPLTRLTTSYLSRAQFGTHLDVGRRFGEQNEWGIRVNGAWRDGEATIRDGNQKVGVASLGLDYAGSRLRWSLDAFTQREDLDEFRPQIGFTAATTSLPAPPSSRRNFFPGSVAHLRDSVVASRVEYDIADRLTAYAGIGYRDGKSEQLFPRGTANALGNFSVSNAYYDAYSKTTSADAGLRARFATGAVGHTLTLGAARLDQEAGNFYLTSATSNASNLYNPAALPAIAGARTPPRKASDTSLYSIALADTLSFAQDRLLITLGLRHQTVELTQFSTTNGAQTGYYKQSAVSPLAGVVFKPVANVSVYGNYTKGLSSGGTAPASAANAGETFAPYKSDQAEAGVKVDWGRVTTVASVYQIARPNALTDPATNVYSFGGEQRNRGLELSAYGEVMRGLRLMTSAAFNDAKLTRTAGAVNQGRDAPGVPDRTFNFAADWDAPWVRGLAFNGRVINTSPVYFNAANSLRFAGWTRLDVGARYRTAVAGKAVVLRANIENLFDRNYWIQSGTYAAVSAPRTVVLSAAIDF